ncbi:TPA: hypothetical protein U5D73_002445 [Yersinia enterocolitica]|uniref:hypothetical protein n=1 Tax=Pectobacterium versatile TaxID=2488639 RepID=UPI001CF2A66C|nr:hypothetical protein [Pectobacterium versatile]EKN5129365.1 hypothetical protein [Yersinia enterocolitica]MCA6917181.1 hypothetical protein [Pectobacterium versatile]HDL8517115.1 hypothetical protein [Yersinia enterocolitica]HDL8555715.1 hypothetical protein [Yersinia enterocolitica]HEN3450004.1 hypothetical protein [Yersinia enterocolitica]
MLPRLSVNDHRYVPSIVQLRKQARFLRDHCDIQLNYAYEMVAYFYRFTNWGDLINYTDSNIAIKNQRDVAQMRAVLQTYRSNLSATDLLQITQLKALPGTLTEAVENDRINVLNDLDILQFHNFLHDKEYWCEPVPVSWYKVLDETDRCLVLLAKRTALTWGIKTVNPHISFPWFGLKMYGYLYVNGNTLNYECRELDSYLWPSEKHYKKTLSRSWFSNYISGFIRTQLRSLCASGFSGKISFSRVNSIDLIKGQIALPYLDEYDDEVTIAPINEIVKNLLDMGGVKDTKKQKITFTFGNGEVY